MIFVHVVASVLALAVVEGAVRADVATGTEGVEDLLQALAEAKISGREIGICSRNTIAK